MDWMFHDGGRAKAGRKGKAGDCVVRAICIVADLPYEKVYAEVARRSVGERPTKRGQTSSPRTGVIAARAWFKRYMIELGFRWVPLMKIGSGCTVHLRAEELPKGRLVCSLSKHYTAVVNGVIYDTYDPSREGTRCVYGWWIYDPPLGGRL